MAIKLQIENNIRKLRFLNGEMTQAELAERVGISRQTVIAIEAQKYLPSLDLAFRLSVALNANITDVFISSVLDNS